MSAAAAAVQIAPQVAKRGKWVMDIFIFVDIAGRMVGFLVEVAMQPSTFLDGTE